MHKVNPVLQQDLRGSIDANVTNEAPVQGNACRGEWEPGMQLTLNWVSVDVTTVWHGNNAKIARGVLELQTNREAVRLSVTAGAV